MVSVAPGYISTKSTSFLGNQECKKFNFKQENEGGDFLTYEESAKILLEILTVVPDTIEQVKVAMKIREGGTASVYKSKEMYALLNLNELGLPELETASNKNEAKK